MVSWLPASRLRPVSLLALVLVAACSPSVAVTPTGVPATAGSGTASEAGPGGRAGEQTATAPGLASGSASAWASLPGAAPTAAAPDGDPGGLEPGACDGLYDREKGAAALSAQATAGYLVTGGFGRVRRFELLADRRVTFVRRDERSNQTRCFRGTVTADEVQVFRSALAQARVCSLPSRRGPSLPDSDTITFAFRLPGLACRSQLVGGSIRQGYDVEKEVARLEAGAARVDAIFETFGRLGRPVCGVHCAP